ncbi:site-specific integrase [Pseudomonas sp.]|uniref:tyrosine-type recombinase/integrase n=1 Tax=Pseudomonas sp. TaxID=306 RepID=UPI003340AD50
MKPAAGDGQRVLRLQPPVNVTWDRTVARWLSQRNDRAPETIRREGHLLAWLQARLQGMPIADISHAVLEELRNQKLEDGAGPRTANYLVGIVSTVLTAAAGWGWVNSAPRIKPLRLPPGRVRWLTHAEARLLLQELSQPLRDMAAFTLETGLRWGNVAGLSWRHVDLSRRVVTFSAAEVKGRSGLVVPLTSPAAQILDLNRGRHPRWVFISQGKRVGRPPRLSWYGALQRACIEDFRWHDLRHTWASWHAQRGTPMLVLQQLGGWKSPSMVARYAHLDTSSLRAHVDAFSDWNRASLARNQLVLDLSS